MVLKFSREGRNGVVREYDLEAIFEVCERCEGHGTHLHPDIGEHAYTMEEFNESFDDEEREQYFKHGGMYDVPCVECKGARVVLVPDVAFLECTTRGRRLLALYNAILDQKAQDRAEMEHERRMGY